MIKSGQSQKFFRYLRDYPGSICRHTKLTIGNQSLPSRTYLDIKRSVVISATWIFPLHPEQLCYCSRLIFTDLSLSDQSFV